LIAIPGEDCFYELFFFDAPMTVYGWAFDSLRRIDY
jgi:hypothetical protein